MFCGNAGGVILPAMIVHRAKSLYDGWVCGGPNGVIYDSTDSGWFDGQTLRW